LHHKGFHFSVEAVAIFFEIIPSQILDKYDSLLCSLSSLFSIISSTQLSSSSLSSTNQDMANNSNTSKKQITIIWQKFSKWFYCIAVCCFCCYNLLLLTVCCLLFAAVENV